MDSGTENYIRFLNGSDDSFVEIIKHYKDGLILYLNGFVGNMHTAEDLAEDTFVRIVTKKPPFGGRCSFKTWLYAIGRNIAVDYCRKSLKHSHISLEECTQTYDDASSVELQYFQEEENISVHRAMQHLKPEYRQVLWLTYFEELSNQETAIIMHKSPHNIETLVYRARQALKKQLEKEGFHNEKLPGHG